MRFGLSVIVLIALSVASVDAKAAASYTSAQATQGATVYTQHCAWIGAPVH